MIKSNLEEYLVGAPEEEEIWEEAEETAPEAAVQSVEKKKKAQKRSRRRNKDLEESCTHPLKEEQLLLQRLQMKLLRKE